MIPINKFLGLYLAIYIFTTLADLFIEFVNARQLKMEGPTVPRPFRSIISVHELEKINAYTLANTVLGVVKTLISKAVFLMIILSGLLPWLAEALRGASFLVGGLVFFAVPALLGGLAKLPFDYYRIFVIEERYGFNTRTLRVWVSDLMKSCLVTLTLGSLLLTILFALLRYGGDLWWLWAWGIFFLFQWLVTVIYPTVIAPLFNEFTPIREGTLGDRIRALADMEGISIKGIFVMDATKRSRHTNAYLSGLGRAKRIVLFDSLIASHEEDEILAVLSHEIGHLKGRHITKQILLLGLVSLALMAIVSRMLTWEMMFRGFGFTEMPLYVGIFLVAVLWEPLGFFLTPPAMALSRKFEREADAHAFRVLKTAVPFVGALKKMARDNLANLRPHPLYVCFNYSHPPLAERIMTLEGLKPQKGTPQDQRF